MQRYGTRLTAALGVMAALTVLAGPAAGQRDDTGRWAFTWSVGWESNGLAEALDEEFTESGFLEKGSRCFLCPTQIHDDHIRWGGGVTYSVGGWYSVNRFLRTELHLVKAGKGWRNGFRSDIGYVELSYSSWSAAALATFRYLTFTVGAGPAILASDWREGRFDGGFFARTWHPGYIVDLGLIIVENERAYAGFQLQRRSYASGSLRFHDDSLDLDYASRFLGLIFGAKF